MKREILFRGYSESLNNWVEGDLIQGIDVLFKAILPIENQDMFEYFIVHPDSVGQFTGLCDMDGNRVFEGDIDSQGRVVEFSYQSFILIDKKTGQKALLGDCEFIEITGNTFQP